VIHISTSADQGNKGPVISRDLVNHWPNFFPLEIEPPVPDISLQEFHAGADVDIANPRAVVEWVESVISQVMASTGAVGYAIATDDREPNRVAAARGFWAMHAEEYSGGEKLLEDQVSTSSTLRFGGVARYVSAVEFARELVAQRNRATGFVLSRTEIDSGALLRRMLQSPLRDHVDYTVHYFLPELVAMVVPSGHMVARLWHQDSLDIDIFALA
jgi:hypothetical protein